MAGVLTKSAQYATIQPRFSYPRMGFYDCHYRDADGAVFMHFREFLGCRGLLDPATIYLGDVSEDLYAGASWVMQSVSKDVKTLYFIVPNADTLRDTAAYYNIEYPLPEALGVLLDGEYSKTYFSTPNHGAAMSALTLVNGTPTKIKTHILIEYTPTTSLWHGQMAVGASIFRGNKTVPQLQPKQSPVIPAAL